MSELENEIAARVSPWSAALLVITCLLLWAVGPSLPQGIAQHPERVAAFVATLAGR